MTSSASPARLALGSLALSPLALAAPAASAAVFEQSIDLVDGDFTITGFADATPGIDITLDPVVGTFDLDLPTPGLYDITATGAYIVDLDPDPLVFELQFDSGTAGASNVTVPATPTLPVINLNAIPVSSFSVGGFPIPGGTTFDAVLDFDALSDGPLGPDAAFTFTLFADPLVEAAIGAFLATADEDNDGSIGGEILNATLDLTLTTVPEPATAGLLALGGACFLPRRRR